MSECNERLPAQQLSGWQEYTPTYQRVGDTMTITKPKYNLPNVKFNPNGCAALSRAIQEQLLDMGVSNKTQVESCLTDAPWIAYGNILGTSKTVEWNGTDCFSKHALWTLDDLIRWRAEADAEAAKPKDLKVTVPSLTGRLTLLPDCVKYSQAVNTWDKAQAVQWARNVKHYGVQVDDCLVTPWADETLVVPGALTIGCQTISWADAQTIAKAILNYYNTGT